MDTILIYRPSSASRHLINHPFKSLGHPPQFRIIYQLIRYFNVVSREYHWTLPCQEKKFAFKNISYISPDIAAGFRFSPIWPGRNSESKLPRRIILPRARFSTHCDKMAKYKSSLVFLRPNLESRHKSSCPSYRSHHGCPSLARCLRRRHAPASQGLLPTHVLDPISSPPHAP